MAGSTELAALGIQFVAEGGDETLNAFLKITGAAESLIQKLNIQVATFGYSKEAMLGYAAAQLGVTDQTQALIRTLTELNVAQERSRIQQNRDLELYRMRGEEAKKLEAAQISEANAYFEAMNAEIAAAEKAASSIIALNAQRNRAMAENRAAAIAMINEQADAAIAAQEAEETRLAVFNAFKIRTMDENRKAAMLLLEEQEKAAEKIAEQQAIAEIKWATLSYEVRIRQLKDLQAYQASNSISPGTTAKQFANIPTAVQGDAAANELAYAAALKVQQEEARKAAEEAKKLASAVKDTEINVSRATSEVVVLGREFSRGNFSKMGGSFTVLAEALGGLLSPITLVGSAIAFVGFEVVKGALEFEKMRSALIMTGNYAGLTAEGLNDLAHSAANMGGTVGNAKEAVTQLAATGKFTSESILTIARAATLMEEVTGQSVSATIKQFEALAVQSTGRSAQATEAVTKATIKLDDQYHFLTVSVLDSIIALDREGDAKGASKIATDALAAAVEKRSKEMAENAGYVLKAWREVKTLWSEMTDSIGNWGKTGPEAELKLLQRSYDQYNNSLMTGLGTDAAKAATQQKLLDIAKQMIAVQATINEANGIAEKEGEKQVATSAAVHAAFAREQADITLKKKTLGELAFAQQEYLAQQEAWRKDDELQGKSVAEDKRLSAAVIAETNALILKAHTPKEAATPANPIDNAIIQMRAKIAGYKAEAEAATQTAATEVSGMVHVNEEQLKAKIAAGEFATLKKGWSADEQAAKIKELEGLAQKADAQKFVLDGAKALSAAQEKTTKDLAALNGKLDDQENGVERIPKTYEDAARALLNFWGKSKDSAEGQKLIADGQLKDLETIQVATQQKLLTDAKSYKIAGEDAMAAGNALATYGLAGRASALDIANVAIAQAKLNSNLSQGVIDAVKSGAATKQLGTAYKDIQTMYQHSLLQQANAAEVSKNDVLGSEQAKVIIIAEAERKKLALYKADADAAIAAARASAKGSTKEQEDAYKLFVDIYNKEVQLSKDTQKLDFNIAGLADVASIFTEMGTAANALSSGLGNVALALNGLGSAFSALAKIEKEEQLTGREMTAEKLGSYGAMAGAASNFFDKNSKGYHTLQTVSQAFYAAEMTMDAAKLAMKVQSSIAEMAADDASMMNSVANSILEAEADASAAIAKCYAQLGPIAGSIAAVAVVGALVAAGVHVLGGGGSSVPDPNSAAVMQKTQGTGTVLGDPTMRGPDGQITRYGAISESISKSLALLSDNSSAMLPLTAQMATSLKNMSDGISGVATLIAGNSQAIANGLNLGISTGKSQTGLMGSIFGSTSTTIANAGLQFGGQSVGGLANGANVNQFATVNKDTKGFLGLFGGSNTSSDQTSGVDASVSQQFSMIFKNLQTSLVSAATGLGMNADAVAKAVSDTQVPLTKISLMGMTGTQQIAAISAVLSAGMDTIAAKVMPNMAQFAQMGEGAFQTTMRVANGIESANVSLKALGLTAINYTQIINKQGDIQVEIARQTMVATQTLAGGVLTGIGNIIQTFQGSAADLTTLWTTLKATQLAMKNAGLASGNLSQDMINGAGGQSNLTKGLSDYLSKFFSPEEQSASELSNLSDQFTALGLAMPSTLKGFRDLVDSIKTATPAGQALQGGVLNLAGAFATAMANANGLTDAATKAAAATAASTLQTATSNLTAAYNAESSALQNTITKFQAFSDSLKAFALSLSSGPLSTLSPEAKYAQSKAAFDSTSALAAAGDPKALGNLQNVAQQFLTDSRNYNASTQAYADDYNKVQKMLSLAATASDKQVSVAQTQLTVMTAQVSSLIEINKSVLSVKDAISAFLAATGRPAPSSVFDAVSSNGDFASTLYGGGWSQGVIAMMNSVTPRAKGGFTPSGLTLVGEQGPELVNFSSPSHISTAEQTRAMMSGGSAENSAEMKNQTTQLKALVAVNQAAAQTAIKLQTQANNILNNISKQSRKAAAMPKPKAR